MKPETRLQIDLVKWVRETYPNVLFTSTQAGDRRSVLAAVMMKRMGYMNGTPDLIFFEPRGCYHGLVLEAKTEKGVLSKDQIAFERKVTERGYKYIDFYGIDQGKDEIVKYFNM